MVLKSQRDIDSDLEEGRRTVEVEARALLHLKERMGFEFSAAVDLVLQCRGRVIATGMGKSGIVARKLAATLTSTGTPTFFLHPAESAHGDMGLVTSEDLVIAMSYGGESEELVPVLSYCARKDIPILAFTSRSESSLGRASRVVLDVRVAEEACPWGLAPTTSTTVCMALGDALAMTVLKRRGFAKENFAELHPGGSLGRRLLTRVKDLMHSGRSLPLVNPHQKMIHVISLMTAQDVRGVAGVVDEAGQLLGVITDGDIRRFLEKDLHQSFMNQSAQDLMSRHPKTVDLNELAEKALWQMEQFKIQILFVVDSHSARPLAPLGLIHLQDLLQAKVR